jgi:hypothetical protein
VEKLEEKSKKKKKEKEDIEFKKKKLEFLKTKWTKELEKHIFEGDFNKNGVIS